MKDKSFNISIEGASHIKNNKECQDASFSYNDDKCAIAIVCDGHGGKDYIRSKIGADIACSVTEKNIKAFIKDINPSDLKKNTRKLIVNLEASIINDWNDEVLSHYKSNSFLEEELMGVSNRIKTRYLKGEAIENAYGTTLIATVKTEDYWFGIHIGDGKCVVVNGNSEFSQPIPWDDKCFLNSTTSICDSFAINNFRYFYSEDLPVAIFIASDGIDDCFITEEQLNNLYRTILYSFAKNEFSDAVEDLKDYLPRLSSKGSGDDISLSAIIDLDKISEIDVVRDFDEKPKS